jgi:hypothetical protein
VQDRWHGVGRDEGAAPVGQEEWILQIPITGPPLTPGQMRWIEQGLRILSVTPLTESEKVAVLGLLASHALSEHASPLT